MSLMINTVSFIIKFSRVCVRNYSALAEATTSLSSSSQLHPPTKHQQGQQQQLQQQESSQEVVPVATPTKRPPPPRLPPMPTIRDLIKLYKLSAIKQLSQNFLLDEKLTNKIVKKGAGNIEDCYVCEVGPGPGPITRSIINKGAKQLLLIEKDKRFKHSLEILNEACSGIQVKILWADVLAIDLSNQFPEELKQDWNDYPPKIRIIGNLPFSVSTPLIIRCLKAISTRENAWAYGRVPLTLTFQEEVAERLVADENHSQRCRLSIMAQYLCHVYHKFSISGSSFVPRPDVNVGVVKLVPRKEPLINQPFPLVEKVVRQVFSMRQKYCRRGASTLFPEMVRDEFTKILFNEADVDPYTRPFQLTIEQFQRLCDTYARICKSHPSIYKYHYRDRKPDETWEELYGQKFKGEDSEDEHESSQPTTSTVPHL